MLATPAGSWPPTASTRGSATGRPDRPRRIGFSTHVRGLDVGNRVEIRFHEEGEIYLTPGGDDTLVAVLGRAAVLRGLRGEDVVARFLGGAPELTAPVLGMGPLGRRVRDLVSGNVVATGDAAGAPDPITGEGMSLALRSALRLADAIARGDLATLRRLAPRARAPRRAGSDAGCSRSRRFSDRVVAAARRGGPTSCGAFMRVAARDRRARGPPALAPGSELLPAMN